jgi:hypothetical protein
MVFSRLSTGVLLVIVLSATAAAQETLLQKLLRIPGLTAAPSQLRGPGEAIAPGNIWIAPVEGGAPKALTLDGGYTSPIFSGDGRVYALRGDTLVRLPQETGAGVTVHKAPKVLKLVGFDGANADELVVLVDAAGGSSPLGVLSLRSGRITPLPVDASSDEQRRMLAQIRSQERTYATVNVYMGGDGRGTSRTTNVYVRRGDAAPRNISACKGVTCVQPALSPDGRSVVFIKAAR